MSGAIVTTVVDAMISSFSNLHSHSHFSFFDGIPTPDEMVVAAKEKGLRSIAITDHGHLHGIADMLIAGKKHGVRTILGVEGYIIHDLAEWRELREKIAVERKGSADDDVERHSAKVAQNRRLLNRKGHLVMLACSRMGLSNLCRIVHRAHRDGMYVKPRADKAILREFSRDVVASSACMGGVVSNKCWQFRRGEIGWDEVVHEAQEFDEIFGRGRFFLELQFNETEGQKFINGCMIRLHTETGIPLTVTTDAHYVRADDWETQEVLYMLRGDKTIATRGPTWSFDVRELYIKSPSEMWESSRRWGDELPVDVVREAFENTLLIDSLVEDYEPDTFQRLPTLPFENPFKELGERSIEALKARGFEHDERYTKRLLYELQMIRDKGIANYFLIVKEIVRRAQERMLIGPGRGSSAGSLVCYLNGITNIDPIEHKLMFERFINVDRTEIPDIDLDFQDVDAVKALMKEMFGSDNVACISTYGTNQIKGIMKDVGRVHDIDHNEINRVNAQIDRELHVLYQQGEAKSAVIIKLEDVYRLSPTFNDFIARYPQVEKPIRRLYGRNNHVGRHASGVVIGDDLPGETPVFCSKGVLQTSFTDGVVNKNLSAMGLVKFDILGLATLNVIDRTCRLVARRSGRTYEDVLHEIDPKVMDFNDRHVLDMVFWRGNLTGIFQFTSSGIRRLAADIRPDCFDDVAAIGALYRPGPLGSGMDKLYAGNKVKAREGTLTYDHPILEEILRETYGCFVYQEHILELGRRLGKLSWKDTNRLRKLFLKRTKDAAAGRDAEGEELKSKLTAGFVENGLTTKYAERTWHELEAWASYGFNSILHNTPIYIIRNGKQLLTTVIDCEPGDFVLSFDQRKKEHVYVQIGAVVDEGEKEILEFTLEDGRQIKCTMDHRFRTTTGEMLSIRQIIKKDLEIASIAGSSQAINDTTETGMRKDVNICSSVSVDGQHLEATEQNGRRNL